MEKLNYGSLCNALKESVNKQFKVFDGVDEIVASKTQVGVIFLIEAAVESLNIISSYNDFEAGKSSYASKVFNNQGGIKTPVIAGYNSVNNRDKINQYIEEVIFPAIHNIDSFMHRLKSLSEDISEFTYFNNAINSSSEKGLKVDFLRECIKYTVNVNNKFSEAKKRQELLIKKYDIVSGDPYGFNDNKGRSTAICIRLESDLFKKSPFNVFDGVIIFHHFENCIDYIIQEGLIILKMDIKNGTIRLIVDEERCEIRKITKTQYSDAIELLDKYVDDFKSKVSWKDYNISQLAAEGLREDVWQAYGYYDKGKLVAYLDYKIRMDRDIELGILVVEEDYRNQGLALSLINLFRLKFPMSRLYSGTYEENIPMIKTFNAAGFKELLNSSGTNKIKERVNPNAPHDEEQYTYSVYYVADPILKNIDKK